jgi:3'-phosphoadenosine 5'-phosphosulfate sulfotransferase (PAPS reductase)/FAD synthetase
MITSDQLQQLQALPLWLKVKKTEQRIKEFYEYNNGDVYISLSGGKDSCLLLWMVRRLYPDVLAVFCDTGLEYPELREHVKTIDNVKWIKPKMSFKSVIEKYGYPVVSKEQSQYLFEAKNTKSEKLRNKRLNGTINSKGTVVGKISEKWKYLLNSDIKISNKCCDIIKKAPFKSFEKKSGLKPFLGVIAIESSLRTQEYKRT